MTDNTKQLADRSLFVYIKDVNTNRIKRVAVPTDLQIGVKNSPAELQLLGRLALSTTRVIVDKQNKGVLSIGKHDTVADIVVIDAPASGRVSVKLPTDPRDGELHVIKDSSGTAGVYPIDISSTGYTIDGSTTRTLSVAYGVVSVYWFDNEWHVMFETIVSSGGGSGGGGDPGATYITLTTTSSLSRERRLNLSGSNLAMTDNGAGSTVDIDLTQVLGAGAGTFTNATVTADAYGRITAIASGSAATAVNAPFVTVTNDATLTQERRLVTGYGLTLLDGGANDAVILSFAGSLSSSAGGAAADVSASYVTIGNTGSLPNERSLVAGTGITITDNGPGSTVIVAAAPVAAAQIAVPVFSLMMLAGVASTNTATSGSKQSIGACLFNPTLLNAFSGSRQYHFRAIIDSSEQPVSAAVDLYDVNGIIRFPPGIITGSVMSSSNPTMTSMSSNITSQLSLVTGSGIFEARLWKTVSGSLTSSVVCRNARIDVEYT